MISLPNGTDNSGALSVCAEKPSLQVSAFKNDEFFLKIAHYKSEGFIHVNPSF